jgi:hypothetical protein
MPKPKELRVDRRDPFYGVSSGRWVQGDPLHGDYIPAGEHDPKWLYGRSTPNLRDPFNNLDAAEDAEEDDDDEG